VKPVFVDTNVFVFAWDASSPDKHARATEWLHTLWDQGAGRTSSQVITELYVTLTRKLRPAIEPATARKYVRTLHAWQPVAPSQALIDLAWEIEDGATLSFWDAMIIAAARQAECARLLSEDLSHGQKIAGVTIVNPFRLAPDAGE
jgi:predicted nucleic acid-binding protein